MRFGRNFLCLCLILSGLGCGTFSVFRPADTLEPAQIDISAGVSANQFNAVPVFKLALGLPYALEIEAQYEVRAMYGSLRYGIFSSKTFPFALSLGGGYGTIPIYEGTPVGAGQTPSITQRNALLLEAIAGVRLQDLDLYLGNRVFWQINATDSFTKLAVFVNKLGFRYKLNEIQYFGAEAGTTYHTQIKRLYFEAGLQTGMIF